MGRPVGSRNATRKKVERGEYLAIFEPAHPLAMADGYVLEHRMVAWDAGILTDPADHVHHRNRHAKHDNRIENLKAMPPSDHHRHHIAEAGAVENQHGMFPLHAETCSIEGCGSPVRARGWCNRHYLRWRRSGDPLGSRRMNI